MLAKALLPSASGQARDVASVGGNLLRRTRCDYFRDVATPLPQAGTRQRLPAAGRREPHPRHPRDQHRLLADGTATIAGTGADLGTGQSTVFAVLAADVLGIPVDRVRPVMGDSAAPTASTSVMPNTAACCAAEPPGTPPESAADTAFTSAPASISTCATSASP